MIEGTYGSSVGSLFNFARWIFLLNLVLFLIWLPLVILPQAIFFDYARVNDTFGILNLLDAGVCASRTL